MRLKAFLFGLVASVVIFIGGGQSTQAQTQTQIQTNQQPKTVIVQEGEYLAKIAEAHQTTWKRLFDANPEIANPDLIYSGQTLRIPTPDKQLAERPLPASQYSSYSALSAPVSTYSTSSPKPVAASSVSDGSVWDRLAQCESGGNWNTNTGNGYYGGLQFTPGTWASVDGSGLPSDVSREEQIARAQILAERRGYSPWPACSAKLGLYWYPRQDSNLRP